MEEEETSRSSPAAATATATVMATESPQASAGHTQKTKASGAAAGGGGRDDCWSDGATEALIDAWGERFMELSRGNLKQKHWQEVADVVSSRRDYTRLPKSDAQCKNRIDTLKKKHKLEKSKIAAASSPSCSSSWPFFSRLDELVCRNQHTLATPADGAALLPPKCNFLLPQLSCKKKRSKKKSHRLLLRKLPPVPKRESTSSGTSPPAAAAAAAAAAVATNSGRGARVSLRAERGSYGKGLREMTEAIVKFGEVYERVERSKLRQAKEMEKQRMVLAKELELQRMQFFMKTQLELTQLKRNGRIKQEEEEEEEEGGFNHDSNSNSVGGDNSDQQ